MTRNKTKKRAFQNTWNISILFVQRKVSIIVIVSCVAYFFLLAIFIPQRSLINDAALLVDTVSKPRRYAINFTHSCMRLCVANIFYLLFLEAEEEEETSWPRQSMPDISETDKTANCKHRMQFPPKWECVIGNVTSIRMVLKIQRYEFHFVAIQYKHRTYQ